VQTYNFTRTQPIFGFRGGFRIIKTCSAVRRVTTYSLNGARRNISFSALIFVLRILLCCNWDFNVCASVWFCFYPLTLQQIILRALLYLMRGLPDYGTYDMPETSRSFTKVCCLYIFAHLKLVNKLITVL
jgi:hypothetical protein